jgi:hypothetical protein
MDQLIQAYAPVPPGNSTKLIFEPVKALPAYTQFASAVYRVSEEVHNEQNKSPESLFMTVSEQWE